MGDVSRIEDLIKAQAYGLGFDLAGITDLGPAGTTRAFDEWLARGYAGEMTYMPRTAEKRRDSRLPFDGATHAIVVAMDYGGREPSGPVARYARGDDYHDVMLERLMQLHAWISQQTGREVAGKAYVDTGPLLERDLARRAGLGWFGKNTMLINPRAGSFFFLGALLVDLELEPDAPFESDHCGTCRRCLDACPTSRVRRGARDGCDAVHLVSHHRAQRRDSRRAAAADRRSCLRVRRVSIRCPWNVRFSQELTEPAFVGA